MTSLEIFYIAAISEIVSDQVRHYHAQKSGAKLLGEISGLAEECKKLYGLKIVYNGQISLHTLKRLRKKLYKIKKEKWTA